MTAAKTLIVLAAFVVGLAGSSLMSVAAAASTLMTRGRARRLAEAGGRGAAALERMIERPSRVAASAALVLAIAYTGIAAVLAWVLQTVYAGAPHWLDVVAAVIISAVVVYLFGETLPRTLAVANPETVGLAVAPWATRVTALVYPVARLLSAGWRWIAATISGEAAPEVPWVDAEELAAHPADQEADTGAEEAEEDIIDNVSGFREKVVREIMVPRPDMVCLEDTAGVDEALAAVADSGFSRLPVYHDTVDDVRGVLYAKDLLIRLGAGPAGISISELARPAFFVPETKSVEELLLEMRNRTHIAIVADEYGGTAGMVTIEDILEEIVGEIFDEYDRAVALVEVLGDGRYRVDARLSIDEMNELFGTALEPEADSVGGLFTEIAGRIPEAGESIEIEGLRLTVEALKGARIRRMTVEPVPAGDRTGKGDDD
jgi:CBS domain containing-hemolysin-like protein